VKTTAQPSIAKQNGNKSVAVGAAVGGVIAIVAIVALAVIITRRRRDAAQAMSSDLNEFQNPTFDQR